MHKIQCKEQLSNSYIPLMKKHDQISEFSAEKHHFYLVSSSADEELLSMCFLNTIHIEFFLSNNNELKIDDSTETHILESFLVMNFENILLDDTMLDLADICSHEI